MTKLAQNGDTTVKIEFIANNHRRLKKDGQSTRLDFYLI